MANPAANALAVQSSAVQDDLPESFVITSLDVELRQCEFRLVTDGDTGSAQQPKQLLVSAAFSGDLQLQLRRSSWAVSATLRSFNVRELSALPPLDTTSATTRATDALTRELVTGNWMREAQVEDYVAKFRIESHAPTAQIVRGAAVEDGTGGTNDTMVERLSFDIDCVAIKIVVNWPCIRALINFFAVERAPLPKALPKADSPPERTEGAKKPQQSTQKVAAPRRVIDLAFKMASPVIVLPQDCSDANSAALVLELGDVQFRRAAEVPTALALNNIAPPGRPSRIVCHSNNAYLVTSGHT